MGTVQKKSNNANVVKMENTRPQFNSESFITFDNSPEPMLWLNTSNGKFTPITAFNIEFIERYISKDRLDTFLELVSHKLSASELLMYMISYFTSDDEFKGTEFKIRGNIFKSISEPDVYDGFYSYGFVFQDLYFYISIELENGEYGVYTDESAINKHFFNFHCYIANIILYIENWMYEQLHS